MATFGLDHRTLSFHELKFCIFFKMKDTYKSLYNMKNHFPKSELKFI